jgi:surface carbohydrate biosynthesis protein
MVTVALPIETKVRELDGKLWLALNLIEADNRVVIGRSEEIHNTLDITKPDIIISKDCGDGNTEYFDRLRDIGITVCGLHTEGGVFNSENRFIHNRKEILNHIDAYFTWGKSQAEIMRHHYQGNHNNLHVTGNPRFDLLQPNHRSYYTNRAASHRSKYGKYVLLNGTFTLANPYGERQLSKSESIYGEIKEEEFSYSSRVFHLFLDAIYNITTKFDNITIIVRPHPGEDNSTYEEEFARHSNIIIEDSGDVKTWIAGAQAVVHHDCTTGIESALMGTPTVSYQPIRNETYDSELPMRVSAEARTREDLINFISESIASDNSYKLTNRRKDHLKQYFHNIDEVAAENICNVINNTGPRDYNDAHRKLTPSVYDRVERRIKSSGFGNQFLALYDFANQLVGNNEPYERRQYRKEKFPGLDKNEIEQGLNQLEKFVEINNMSVEKVPLTTDTFYIY